MSNQTGPNEAPRKGIDKQPMVALGAEPSSPGRRGPKPSAPRAGVFHPSASIYQTLAGNPTPEAAPVRRPAPKPGVQAPGAEPLQGLPSVSLSGPRGDSGAMVERAGRARPESAAATLVGQGLSPELRAEIRAAIGKSVVPTQPCSVPQAGNAERVAAVDRSERTVLGGNQPVAAHSEKTPEPAARKLPTPPPRKVVSRGLSGMAGPQSEPIPLFRSTRLREEVRAELLAEQGRSNSQSAITDSLRVAPRIVQAQPLTAADPSSLGTDTGRTPSAAPPEARADASARVPRPAPAAPQHNPYRVLVDNELAGAEGGRVPRARSGPAAAPGEPSPAPGRFKVVRWTFTALLAAGTIALFVEQILAAP